MANNYQEACHQASVSKTAVLDLLLAIVCMSVLDRLSNLAEIWWSVDYSDAENDSEGAMDYPAASLSELVSYLDGLDEPSIVMDASYRILAANRAYAATFGDAGPVAGRHCYEVSHRFVAPCDQAGEPCPLSMSRHSGQAQRVLHLHHTPAGEEHVDVQTTPIRDRTGHIVYFVETMHVVRQASSRPAAEGLVGRSPAFQSMLGLALRVAPTSASVLLRGATGTGKELLARLIHEAGRTPRGPFVVVDCSGLSESLFESELFGYEKGAFTGAQHRKTGLVEAANGGTLFLDEVGDIPAGLQIKLLRLLENGTFRRVGSVEVLRSTFRLISATHRDLETMVSEERFRRDLYHRINTFPVHVPSLAERAEDIPLLAESLLRRLAGERRLRLAPDAMAALQVRHWSGNIRELRNLIERATVLADGEVIEACHFGMDIPGASMASGPVAVGGGFYVDTLLPLAEVEQRYLVWAAAQSGRRASLAQQLGVGQRTLFRKLAAGKPERA